MAHSQGGQMPNTSDLYFKKKQNGCNSHNKLKRLKLRSMKFFFELQLLNVSKDCSGRSIIRVNFPGLNHRPRINDLEVGNKADFKTD